VTQLKYDYRLTLDFWKADAAMISVCMESNIVFAAERERSTLTPENPGSMCASLQLLHKVVDSASVDREAVLTLRFTSGLTISVSPTEQYEAWQVWLDNGEMLVCGPGGLLSHFPPNAS
jgi:hypothetical protein